MGRMPSFLFIINPILFFDKSKTRHRRIPAKTDLQIIRRMLHSITIKPTALRGIRFLPLDISGKRI